MKVVLLLSLFALGPGCHAYPSFRDKIPNGRIIPHPCMDNVIWEGVGHRNPGGGGPRNPFGTDFDQNGRAWDETLCNKDSDGDGLTNGEELGDPDCVWSEGQVPAVTVGLSHPGVCDPIDSATCLVRNADLGDFCELGGTVNPCIEGIQNQAGVQSLSISFPKTPVPPKETTYMCQTFALPTDTDYHIIASAPSIDNLDVVHHIIVFGCDNDVEVTGAPQECFMAESSCSDILLFWSVGLNGNCLNEAFGFRVGQSGFRKIMMQVHWNNPELRSDYTDGSGMVVYYTPNLRPNDGAIMKTGQRYLEIPAGEADHLETGFCQEQCTEAMSSNIYIAESAIHMHLLGSNGYIEHYRDGTKITDLLVLDIYRYDTPVFFAYDIPVEFRPGDTIKTFCHYDSTDRSETTNNGGATSDEMCYGFLAYFPKAHGMKHCLSNRNQAVCEGAGDCDVTAFVTLASASYSTLTSRCDVTGLTCYPACLDLLSRWFAAQPCLQGDSLIQVMTFILQTYGNAGVKAVNAFESCEDEVNALLD